MEHYWCNILNASNYKYGYNLKATHPENRGSNSRETNEKIRVANTGKKPSLETRLKLSLAKLGRKLSKEHKEKISKGNIGKTRTVEMRNKISKNRLAKPPEELKYNVGRKLSKESIDKRTLTRSINKKKIKYVK